MKRRDFLAGSAATAWAGWTSGALAQSGPITKIVYPFAAGGGGDALCRLVAQHIAPALDRSIIVENRTGGDGLIGIRAAKGASPDGTTILLSPPTHGVALLVWIFPVVVAVTVVAVLVAMVRRSRRAV